MKIDLQPLRSGPTLSFAKVISRLAIALLLIDLLVASLAALSLQQSRLHYDDQAALASQNLVRLLDHDIAASIRLIDLTLLATVNEAERQLGAGGIQGPSLSAFIERQFAQQSDLDGLRATDPSGTIAYGTGMASGLAARLADRDYFIRLKNDANAGLVVSEPLRGRTSGKWVITIARRYIRSDGSFAGIVYGTITLAHFTKAFSSLHVDPGSSFTLFDNSLSIITRQPEPGGIGSSVGKKFASPQLQEAIQAGKSEATYRVFSTVDGIERVYSYRRIEGLPFNIVIGLATEDYLAGWRDEARKTLTLVTLFLMATLLLSWLIYRAWKRLDTAMAAFSEANRTLDAERNLKQAIIDSSPLAIYTRDLKGIVTAWNKGAEQMFGWREEDILGQPMPTVPTDKLEETDNLRHRVLDGEIIVQAEVRRQRRDGSPIDINTTLAPLRDSTGQIYGYLAIAADITERKAAEQQIEILAYRDVLTGLPNRLLVQDRFEQAIASADRTKSRVALFFLDLDNFKTINDSLGHAVGDALLKEIASRLNECVRDTDTISRQGGDEFLIVVQDLPDAEAASPVLLKIMERLQDPFHADGHELSTSVSIGIALYPEDGADFDTLLKKADMAMYRAKESGRNAYRYFDEQMNVEAVDHLSMRNGLRKALERDEFVLHYQPQIDLASGAVVGVEALIRWNHPESGMIAPARFIPVAEESGLIVPIGAWVMKEACRQAMAWRRAGLPQLTMAVNLSAVQFRRGDVEQTLISALEESGFDPAFLELELTESILIHNTESVLATVKRLKLLGVKLSIDDFGTGYSSLSYLKRFAVDKLKIDQSFIRDLASDPDDAAIVRAIIQMARSLNLKTIAEGVEDHEMLEHLRIFHCDEAQGYYFARPMPAEEFVRYLLRSL